MEDNQQKYTIIKEEGDAKKKVLNQKLNNLQSKLNQTNNTSEYQTVEKHITTVKNQIKAVEAKILIDLTQAMNSI